MLTRNKSARLSLTNFSKLPVELVSIILLSFDFPHIAKLSEINKEMKLNVENVISTMQELKGNFSVKSIDYIIKKCVKVEYLPRFCGAKKYDVKSMKKLLKRWPSQLILNWDMMNAKEISRFVESINVSTFKNIKELSLKLSDDKLFGDSKIDLPFMNLKLLNIDAEGCDLEYILTGLDCRSWHVEDLYLRGDVYDLCTLMMYSPCLTSKVTIINTNDRFCSHCSGTEQGLRYICNTGIDVNLYNIIKFCCNPPGACSIVELFKTSIMTSLFVPKNGVWKVDRLTVEMIEILISNSCVVYCGVFQCDLKRIEILQKQNPGKLYIMSVL